MRGYTQEQVRMVLALKDAGMSHRNIAEEALGSRTKASTVHLILSQHHSAYNGLQAHSNFVRVGGANATTAATTVASEYYGLGEERLERGNREYDIYAGDVAKPITNLKDAKDIVGSLYNKSRVHKSTPDTTPLRIMFIPDAQVKKGVEINHLRALGNYIVDKKPDVLVNIGDFADMPSLSQYEKAGSKNTEGSRYADDIKSVHTAMDMLLQPLHEYNAKCFENNEEPYMPRMIMTLGNHEHRITRAIDDNPRHFEGVISLDDLGYEEAGWEVYPFLEMVEVGGVYFSHYFCNPTSLTKNVIGGMMETKLKNLGFSFAMGHQQLLQHGILYRTNGDSVQGLVAGSFYQHDEGYMNIQGNRSHWRGAVMMNQVENGNYDIMPLSMSYLLEKWDY